MVVTIYNTSLLVEKSGTSVDVRRRRRRRRRRREGGDHARFFMWMKYP